MSNSVIEYKVFDGVANICLSRPKQYNSLNGELRKKFLQILDEIENESRAHFIEAGGENFSVIPCLNASDESIAMLEKIIKRELGGWYLSTC